MSQYDAVIIGAGMAGASLASHLAADMQVALLEKEDVPGYHSTGRSAAFWDESYGGPDIQPLTSLSGPWLAEPPADFASHGFLRKRGALTIGRERDVGELTAQQTLFANRGVAMKFLQGDAVSALVPGLASEWHHAVYEPDCCDIDVGGLHQAYLSSAKRQGAQLHCRAGLVSARRDNGVWRITLDNGETLKSPLIINAAGAWADHIAQACDVAPLGIIPLRRTVVQLRTNPAPPADLPLVIDVGGSFYFKPEAGRLWLSPHDETPTVPCDAAPEEMDVALAIDRLQSVVAWQVEAVEHRWAGLRSFSSDRVPAFGYDPHRSGFFWFVGQGGYGIQTAPAAAQIAQHMITGEALPETFRDLDIARYAASRFSAIHAVERCAG